MKFYHATTQEAYFKILTSKKIKTGIDGLVYLGETAYDAAKFKVFDAIAHESNIFVFEVELDPADVVETFDHSFEFFHSRAFGCAHDIPIDYNNNVTVYSPYDSGEPVAKF